MATKKTDTIAGKTIQLGIDHSVTIEAARGRKVTRQPVSDFRRNEGGTATQLPGRSVTC